MDKYNRQLHQSEAENLANLKKGKSAAQQHRLDAAACALVNCADGLPVCDPLYAKLSAWQKEGQGYIAEQTLLKATGEFVYQPGMDATRDAITRYGEGLHRTGGLVNLGAGSVGAVGGTALAVTGAAACPATLGGGCAAAVFGGYIAVSSRAQAQQGSQALFSKYTSSEGSRVLASFNPQTYPGERDPIVEVAKDAGMLGFAMAAGKYIPKWLSAAEGLTVPKVGGAAGIAKTSEMTESGANSVGAAEAPGAGRTAGWPGVGGSGPVPGTIGITDQTAVGSLRNYSPKGGGIEFVYDPATNTFVTGRPTKGLFDGSPHEQLAQSIGAAERPVVGGTFHRGANGEIFTTENSGHYGQNWTNANRNQFQDWLNERLGIPVKHQPWDK